MNNKTDEIEAKEEKERKAQVGGVNIPSSPFPPGSTSTNNPLWRGAAFRWESFDLRGAGSSPRYESSSREEGGGGKSLPATENGSISTIRYFLSLVGARNIRKLANKKYPSDLLPSLHPPRRISGSRFKRETHSARFFAETKTGYWYRNSFEEEEERVRRESFHVHPFPVLGGGHR